MPVEIKNIVPIGTVRKDFTQLAEDARQGAEKVITKDGAPYVAIISAEQLEHYHQLEAERQQVSILGMMQAALEDMQAGRVMSAAEFKAKIGR